MKSWRPSHGLYHGTGVRLIVLPEWKCGKIVSVGNCWPGLLLSMIQAQPGHATHVGFGVKWTLTVLLTHDKIPWTLHQAMVACSFVQDTQSDLGLTNCSPDGKLISMQDASWGSSWRDIMTQVSLALMTFGYHRVAQTSGTAASLKISDRKAQRPAQAMLVQCSGSSYL